MISTVDKLENVLCSFLNVNSSNELMNELVNEYYDLIKVWSDETNLSTESLIDCIEYYLNKDITWFSDSTSNLCKVQLGNNISFSFDWNVDTVI